jgi:hypothetical protein
MMRTILLCSKYLMKRETGLVRFRLRRRIKASHALSSIRLQRARFVQASSEQYTHSRESATQKLGPLCASTPPAKLSAKLVEH